jgi:hypothetical protein
MMTLSTDLTMRELEMVDKWLGFQIRCARADDSHKVCFEPYNFVHRNVYCRGRCKLRRFHPLDCAQANKHFAFNIDTFRGEIFSNTVKLRIEVESYKTQFPCDCIGAGFKCEVYEAVFALLASGKVTDVYA